MPADPRVTAALAAARERAHLRDAILAERACTGTLILTTPAPQPTVSIQSVPGVDAPAPAPAPASEVELGTLLDHLLPQIMVGVEQARAAYGDRRITRAEAAALAVTVMGIVSKAVHDGAPLVQDASARCLVLLIYGVLFTRYVVPLLPVWVRPFAGVIKAGVVRGLESLYRTLIKKRQTPRL